MEYLHKCKDQNCVINQRLVFVINARLDFFHYPMKFCMLVQVISFSELVFEFENGTGAIEDDPSLYDLQLPSDERNGLTRFWTSRGVSLVVWQRDGRRSPVISVAHRGGRAEQKELLTLLAGVFTSNPFVYDL